MKSTAGDFKDALRHLASPEKALYAGSRQRRFCFVSRLAITRTSTSAKASAENGTSGLRTGALGLRSNESSSSFC